MNKRILGIILCFSIIFSSIADCSASGTKSFILFVGFALSGVYLKNQSNSYSDSSDQNKLAGDRDMSAAKKATDTANIYLNYMFATYNTGSTMAATGQDAYDYEFEHYKFYLTEAENSRNSAMYNYSDASANKAYSNTYSTLSSASYVFAGYYFIKMVYEINSKKQEIKTSKKNNTWRIVSNMS